MVAKKRSATEDVTKKICFTKDAASYDELDDGFYQLVVLIQILTLNGASLLNKMTVSNKGGIMALCIAYCSLKKTDLNRQFVFFTNHQYTNLFTNFRLVFLSEFFKAFLTDVEFGKRDNITALHIQSFTYDALFRDWLFCKNIRKYHINTVSDKYYKSFGILKNPNLIDYDFIEEFGEFLTQTDLANIIDIHSQTDLANFKTEALRVCNEIALFKDDISKFQRYVCGYLFIEDIYSYTRSSQNSPQFLIMPTVRAEFKTVLQNHLDNFFDNIQLLDSLSENGVEAVCSKLKTTKSKPMTRIGKTQAGKLMALAGSSKTKNISRPEKIKDTCSNTSIPHASYVTINESDPEPVMKKTRDEPTEHHTMEYLMNELKNIKDVQAEILKAVVKSGTQMPTNFKLNEQPLVSYYLNNLRPTASDISAQLDLYNNNACSISSGGVLSFASPPPESSAQYNNIPYLNLQPHSVFNNLKL